MNKLDQPPVDSGHKNPESDREPDFSDMPMMITASVIAKQQDRRVGGKAYHLAKMAEQGLAVPPFVILTREPAKDQDWESVMQWWDGEGRPALAIRSSALGEDSSGYSYAGQLSSYLNIETVEDLKKAVRNCFASISREASLAYQEHFQQQAKRMSVVVQQMIYPKFSGVFFSVDPRGLQDSWVLEFVEGYGEDLVSGRKTPYLFTQEKKPAEVPTSWQQGYLEAVIALGAAIKNIFHYEIDIEWTIDGKGKLWALQARPITTGLAQRDKQVQIDRELKRLQEKYADDVVWDGQTLGEFVGFPSYLTFSIWKMAFAKDGAFGKALKMIGYAGFEKVVFSEKESLLERVFGRVYINLNLLNKLYFGKIPYSIKMKPRQHLEFDWKKLDFATVWGTPRALWQMLRVMLRLQGSRKALFAQCEGELHRYQLFAKPFATEQYAEWTEDYLLNALKEQAQAFANEYLVWPFVLIMMIESTQQVLLSNLGKVVGPVEADKLLNIWMAKGIATVTAEMTQDFKAACAMKEKRWSFLEKYGHRGPGEMDLTNPRWIELGDKAFVKTTADVSQAHEPVAAPGIEAEIAKVVSGIRLNLVLEEWGMLKKMLELREFGKMATMKSYANIRWLSSEIGRRNGLGDDVFWLRLSEVVQLKSGLDVQEKIKQRKPRFHVFRKLSFPAVVSLSQIAEILQGGDTTSGQNLHAFDGEALSPGLVYGQVRVVEDPTTIDFSDWPEDAILVAEATDPGWTVLFQRVKGIVVERGGVLSHCAILAREMGLPAVSRILNCTQTFKDGDYVWIDGSNGRVTRA